MRTNHSTHQSKPPLNFTDIKERTYLISQSCFQAGYENSQYQSPIANSQAVAHIVPPVSSFSLANCVLLAVSFFLDVCFVFTQFYRKSKLYYKINVQCLDVSAQGQSTSLVCYSTTGTYGTRTVGGSTRYLYSYIHYGDHGDHVVVVSCLDHFGRVMNHPRMIETSSSLRMSANLNQYVLPTRTTFYFLSHQELSVLSDFVPSKAIRYGVLSIYYGRVCFSFFLQV